MDVLEQYVGVALLVAGIALFSIPVAMIAAGLLLAVHGTLRELKREDDDGTREPPAIDDTTGNPRT